MQTSVSQVTQQEPKPCQAVLPEEDVCMGLLSQIPQRNFSGKSSPLAAKKSFNAPLPRMIVELDPTPEKQRLGS